MICQDTTIFQDTKVCEDTPVCRDATVCQDTTVYHDNDNTVYQETLVCQDTLREDQKCGSFLQSMIENTLTWGWEVLIFFLQLHKVYGEQSRSQYLWKTLDFWKN